MNIFRAYNQNRKTILIIILVIVAVIILLQLLNYLTKKNIENKEVSNTTVENKYGKNYEAVTGERKEDATYSTQTNVIKNFLDACVNGDTETAYNLISDDCKNALYPSINNFIDGYYNINFKDKKISYNYQAWSGNTYKIEFRENILSTGMYSDSAYKEEYYTLDGNKLNISGYVKKEEINAEEQKQNITITVDNLEYYRDYLVCNISVFNQTDNDILLDSLENAENITLMDRNEVEFTYYNDELDESEVKVYKGQLMQISLKFNVVYRENLEMRQINFKNIIKNYAKYQSNELEESDITNIEIDI